MVALTDSSLLKQSAFIDGEWVDGVRKFAVHNPADGALIAEIPDLGVDETRHAIQAASRAWEEWRSRTAKERGALLKEWFSLIMRHQEDLARLMTAEQGKPLSEARGEVAYGASFIEWYGEEAKRIYGDITPSPIASRRLLTIKQSVGVVAAITPWNFPIAMITRKCAPALAAGCPVVVKPAEDTPLCALALAALAERAGFPKGVFNVITAKDPVAVGYELSTNPLVRKLSFTGSTEVGRLLMRQASDSIKKISLELGGCAPFIVFDDADLEAAVGGAMASKFRNGGQTCVSANRLMVQDKLYDAFVEKLTKATAKLMVGAGDEPNVSIGPLINAHAVEKVMAHIADARAKGGQVVLGGDRHPRGGTFFQPTVIAEATAEMLCMREETFGPVAPILRFHSEEEAISLANDTPFGLAAYAYTRDIGRCWRVAEGLEYGMIGLNEGVISTEVAPFGGVKQSGLGREGAKYGIEEYLEIKYICMGGL